MSQNQEGDIRPTSPFLKKAENYWYHYKWHTIIGLFLLLTLLICTLQMCKKPSYDTEIIYAGHHSITKMQQSDIKSSLGSLMKDKNEDGEISLNVVPYWIDTDILQNDKYAESDTAFLQQAAMQNRQNFEDEISAGDVVIYFLSQDMFLAIMERDCLFSLEEVVPNLSQDCFALDKDGNPTSFGVRLDSLPFGNMAGFAELPDDTVVCMQSIRYLNHIFNHEQTEANFAYAKDLMYSILTYTGK
ncbi:MAG: hypothetical protein J6K61_04265 [Clostridia bacterium]|nr:hypothetical protein [Clostridia bacterium]